MIYELEVNSDSSIFLATGKAENKWVLVASSFDGYFDCVSALTFDSEIYGLRRINKTDYYVVGGKDKIHILQLTAKNVLVEITVIKDLQVGVVQRIEIEGQNMYLLDKDGDNMCALYFAKSLDKLQ